MCGIFGYYARSGVLPDTAQLCALTDTLRHRGPDGGGFWSDERFFLGHRRLAIIDLALGDQPMASAEGRYLVTFNGEIYNYVELRAELEQLGHRLRTASDTEVLLAGYAEWREELPRHLTGMFAFAIVDRDERSLFLARDRFGEKPLLYRELGNDVAFASELRPLALLNRDPGPVDEQALTDFLMLNYVPGDQTLLRSVRRLQPGSWRMYREAGVTHAEYWQPAPDQLPPRLRIESAVETLRARLDESVRIALRSDVPIALFLSGGVDSSVVAESAARQGRLTTAFCLDFEDSRFSEWDQAAFVAQRLGLSLERVILRPAALQEHFFDLVDHADDPLADSSALAVWVLARETGRSFKVAISGDGGDELFGGYLTYRATALHGAVISRLPASLRAAMARRINGVAVGDGKVSSGYKLMRFLRAAELRSSEAHFTWNGSWTPSSAAALVRPESRADAHRAAKRLAERHRLPDRPSLAQLQQVDLREYLPNDILVKIDRMTMAHGLEARAPLLNHELAAFALGATSRFARPLAKPKRLLRRLATDLFGPRIGAAKKQGFSIPIHDWLRGPARDLVGDLLSQRSVRQVGFLDASAVLDARDGFLLRRAPIGFEIWGLMVLMAWMRARVLCPSEVTVPSAELKRVQLS